MFEIKDTVPRRDGAHLCAPTPRESECRLCTNRSPPQGQISAARITHRLMFENLQEQLQRTFKSLRGQAVLSQENMQEALRELRLALLEADVNFKVVKQFIDQVQAKSV